MKRRFIFCSVCFIGFPYITQIIFHNEPKQELFGFNGNTALGITKNALAVVRRCVLCRPLLFANLFILFQIIGTAEREARALSELS